MDNPEDRFNQTATFKVLGHAKIQAKFSKIPLQLNLDTLVLDQNDNPLAGEVGASINQPNSIFYGDLVDLDLTLNQGYTLLYWIDLDTGLTITSQRQLSFTATSDRNINVILRKLHYQLEISQTVGGSSSVHSESPFYFRDPIQISAFPDDHWEFFRWTGIGSENLDDHHSSHTILSIEKDSSLQPEFKKKEYILSVNSFPEDYGGFSSIENSYNYGDIVTIQAIPREGKLFERWEIDGNITIAEESEATNNPTSFVVKGNNASIRGIFKSKQYSVSYRVIVVDENGTEDKGAFGGRVIGGTTFEDEDIAEFSYSLSNGYRFKYWQIENGGASFKSTDKIYEHQMLGDLNLTAVVSQRKYEVGVELSPASGGKVTLNDLDDNLSQSGFSYGENIRISATPSPGYRFVKWTATGTNLPTTSLSEQTFSIGNDVQLTAFFAPTGKVNLTLRSSPSDATSYMYGSGSYDYNPEHAILTLPKSGFTFSHWEYNGSIAMGVVRDANSSTTTVSLDGDKVLTAIFLKNSGTDESSNEKFLLSVYSNNTTRGTTSGSGFFRGSRTIKAFPKSGYEFSHWEGATLLDAYAATTEVDVYATTSVVAHFQSIGVFDDSEVLENGWWGNPWFGYFWKVGEDDWLFHEKLGWIFLKKKGDSSIWVWIQKMDGWFWTAKEHYPYLHSASSQTWYWINLVKSDFTELVIYDYANAKWSSF